MSSHGETNHQCSSMKYAIASTSNASATAASRDCEGVSLTGLLRIVILCIVTLRIGIASAAAQLRGEVEMFLAGLLVGLDHALQLGFGEERRLPQAIDQAGRLGALAL